MIKDKVVSEVKWFNETKGFGFILNPDLSNLDVFVHYSELNMSGFKTVQKGDKVEFLIENSSRGLIARDVSKV